MDLVYQQMLISLLKEKLKVTVKFINKKYTSVSNRVLLFDDDCNLIVPDIMTSQHATLVLAIYMHILEGLNVSQNLLLIGDALVFSGMYNSKFNSDKFLAHLSSLKEEISKFQPTTFTITDIQVSSSYYGLNKNHINLFFQLNIFNADKYNDMATFIQQLVDDAGENTHKIFTFSRFINMIENKPDKTACTNKDFISSIISNLQKSEFININQTEPTGEYNRIVKTPKTVSVKNSSSVWGN